MKALGIDLGGTQIKFGIVEKGRVLDKYICNTPVAKGYEGVLKEIVSGAKELLKRHEAVGHIGLGSPGLIDTELGVVRYSNNIDWQDAPICHDLERMLEKPVAIANDAQCAALGEALYGAGKGYGRMAMVTIGTGVGGGFVRDGRLEMDGYGSMAYIFGHSVVVNGGRVCNCGRKGCLETYASAAAVAERGSRMFVEEKTCKQIFEAARQEDALARGVIDEFLEYLSVGIVNIANILRPHMIVIGGGVSASCDLILPRLSKALEDEVYGYRYAPVKLACAVLGNDAGLVGAANLEKKSGDKR